MKHNVMIVGMVAVHFVSILNSISILLINHLVCNVNILNVSVVSLDRCGTPVTSTQYERNSGGHYQQLCPV